MSNTTIRILVSIIAIPAIVLASYFGSYYFYVFVLGIGVISYYEFWTLVKKKDVSANLYIGLFAVALIITNSLIMIIDYYFLILILLVVITLVELFRNSGSAVLNLGTSLLGILYIGIFSSSLIFLREFYISDYTKGGLLIISIFASIWVCDSAAFFAGNALGKHKLYPRVSPNKSWEGAIFGLIFAIITMIVARIIVLNYLSWIDAIILGIIVGVIGQVGDLIESLFKRDVDVKDSSNLIPGHGGIFDRFDSLLYTAPAIFLYLTYLA